MSYFKKYNKLRRPNRKRAEVSFMILSSKEMDLIKKGEIEVLSSNYLEDEIGMILILLIKQRINTRVCSIDQGTECRKIKEALY